LQSANFIIGVFELVILIFSLSVHECSHAWMASRLGDQTARLQGRVTLNPIYHVDPIGTLIFPAIAIFGPFIGLSMFSGMLIGWAKPTPVISRNFQKIRRDENLVTLAGPASNLLLVLIAFLVLVFIAIAFPGGHDIVRSPFQLGETGGVFSAVQAVALLSTLAVFINLSLFFFNFVQFNILDFRRHFFHVSIICHLHKCLREVASPWLIHFLDPRILAQIQIPRHNEFQITE